MITYLDNRYIEKIARESSSIGDFLSGVDPTGAITFNQSIENRKRHKRHIGVGMVGAFLGGSTLIPMGIYGATRGVAAAVGQRGFANKLKAIGREAIYPYKTLFKSISANRALKNIKNKMPSDKQLKNLRDIMGNVDLRDINNKAKDLMGKISLKDVGKTSGSLKNFLSGMNVYKNGKEQLVSILSDPNVNKALRSSIRNAAIPAVAGIGLAGTINSLSTLAQYRSGQKAQKRIDEAKRSQSNRR